MGGMNNAYIKPDYVNRCGYIIKCEYLEKCLKYAIYGYFYNTGVYNFKHISTCCTLNGDKILGAIFSG